MSNMSNRPFVIRILAGLLVFSIPAEHPLSVSAATSEGTEAELYSYETGYKANVDRICKPKWGPSNSGESQGSLLTAAEFSYPRIGDPAADEKYREGIKTVTGDASGLETALFAPESGNPFDFGRDVKAASEVYKERMNAIFACAQLNLKVRIHENVIRTIAKNPKANPNSTRSLKAQNTVLKQEMSRRKCADRTQTTGNSNVMIKSQVLRQTTFEYCNYRHYLQYLKSNAQHRAADSIFAQRKAKKEGGEAPAGNAEQLASAIATYAGTIENEIQHTRNVFPQAMVALSEFERNYPSHVVMVIILEDYATLRDVLKKVMNPLGQVIYKASNAQSPFSP